LKVVSCFFLFFLIKAPARERQSQGGAPSLCAEASLKKKKVNFLFDV
jgi:hypothetical protein